MLFCTYFGLRALDPHCDTLCMYVQFLTRSIKSPQTIKNYISGVRLLHKQLNIASNSLESFELNLMLRAISITMNHIPKPHIVLSVDIFHQLATCAQAMGAPGIIMHSAILMSFFGFLRISNLAPMSDVQFHPKRNTCRGDVLLEAPGLIVLLRWTKTTQCHERIHLIPLPEIPGHRLCPVTAYKAMMGLVPTSSPNDPVFMMPYSRQTITTKWLSEQLGNMSECLGFRRRITFHDFRRAGAKLCYMAGVNFTNIKQHGTWSSEAFWTYISRETLAQTSPIPATLTSLVVNAQ